MLQIALYKGIRPGIEAVYSHAVRWWMHGIYSHCELYFSDGMSASASFIDGGVRYKEVVYDDPENWDIFVLPSHYEAPARAWFDQHLGAAYDLRGNFRMVFQFERDSRNKYFCSEAVAAALGIEEAWRIDPNMLAIMVPLLQAR